MLHGSISKITCYGFFITCYRFLINCYRFLITCYRFVIPCCRFINCYRFVITCYRFFMRSRYCKVVTSSVIFFVALCPPYFFLFAALLVFMRHPGRCLALWTIPIQVVGGLPSGLLAVSVSSVKIFLVKWLLPLRITYIHWNGFALRGHTNVIGFIIFINLCYLKHPSNKLVSNAYFYCLSQVKTNLFMN